MTLVRRDFLKASAALPSAAALQPQPAARTADQAKMIGIQIGAVSFVDEGTEKVLDILQEKAHINTLFLAVFTYGRGIAGRQVPGQPLPDHGKQEYDPEFRGGNYATVHPEFYRNTVLKDTRARDHGNLDILAEVLPAAKKRGLKTYCWLEDVWRNDVPNIEKVQEVDLYGQRRSTLCMNNPDHRAFLTALVEDYTRSYDIDGIMWGSERHGALGNAIGASHGGRTSDPSRVGCFCPHCERKAKDHGISIERAREGYRQLEAFVKSSRGGKRPSTATTSPSGAFSSATPKSSPGSTSSTRASAKTTPPSTRPLNRPKPACQSAGTSGTPTPSAPSTAQSRTCRNSGLARTS